MAANICCWRSKGVYIQELMLWRLVQLWHNYKCFIYVGRWKPSAVWLLRERQCTNTAITGESVHTAAVTRHEDSNNNNECCIMTMNVTIYMSSLNVVWPKPHQLGPTPTYTYGEWEQWEFKSCLVWDILHCAHDVIYVTPVTFYFAQYVGHY